MSTNTALVTKKKTLAPKLRFGEFKEPWELKRLGDLSLVITKGTTPSYFSESGISFVKIEGLEGILINKGKCLFIDKTIHEGELKRSILEDGDILFAIAGATIGKVALVTSDILPANTNQALAIIRLRESKSRMLVLQILQSWIMKKYIKLSIVTGAQPNLNLEQVGNFSFNFPSLPEQQNIASFLSAVDEKIQQLTRKKELLEQYKKGVMQQLFSGKLRFKDENGKPYPKWEEKKLGAITSLLKDGSHGTHTEYPEGEHFLLSAKNIVNGRIHFDATDRRISEAEFKSIYKNYNLKENDILLTIVGTIGRVALYRLEKNIVFQRSVAFFRFDNDEPEFMLQLMNEAKFQMELDRRKVVSAQPGIYLGDLAKIPVHLPCVEEQKKIASFLTALDAKIESVATQIAQTQTFKKGLLQQMFV